MKKMIFTGVLHVLYFLTALFSVSEKFWNITNQHNAAPLMVGAVIIGIVLTILIIPVIREYQPEVKTALRMLVIFNASNIIALIALWFSVILWAIALFVALVCSFIFIALVDLRLRNLTSTEPKQAD